MAERGPGHEPRMVQNWSLGEEQFWIKRATGRAGAQVIAE